MRTRTVVFLVAAAVLAGSWGAIATGCESSKAPSVSKSSPTASARTPSTEMTQYWKDLRGSYWEFWNAAVGGAKDFFNPKGPAWAIEHRDAAALHVALTKVRARATLVTMLRDAWAKRVKPGGDLAALDATPTYSEWVNRPAPLAVFAKLQTLFVETLKFEKPLADDAQTASMKGDWNTYFKDVKMLVQSTDRMTKVRAEILRVSKQVHLLVLIP